MRLDTVPINDFPTLVFDHVERKICLGCDKPGKLLCDDCLEKLQLCQRIVDRHILPTHWRLDTI